MMRTRHHRSDRGAVLPLAAISLVTLIGIAALAIDIGLGASRTRDLQLVADLVAVDVARLLDGRTASELDASGDVDAQAEATAEENGFEIDRTGTRTFAAGERELSLVLGFWGDDPSTPLVVEPDFFRPVTAPATDRPDAVQVLVGDEIQYQLATVMGFARRDLDRDATAARIPLASVEIGSVGAGLSTKLDPTVGGASATAYIRAMGATLFGSFQTDPVAPAPTNAQLDALSYDGLADADVELRDVATGVGAGSPEELAGTQTTVGGFFDAMIFALQNSSDPDAPEAAAEATAFKQQLTQTSLNQAMTLSSDYFDIEQGTGACPADSAADTCAASATMNALGLLTGTAQVINGNNFADLSFQPQIPGLNGIVANVQTTVIEAPRYAWGRRVVTQAETAQIRARINLQIPGNILPALLGNLNSPVTLPLVVEFAQGTAQLTRTECYEPITASESDLLVTTSGARVRVGVASDAAMQVPAGAAVTVTSGVLVQSGFLNLDFATDIGVSLLSLLGLTSGVQGTATASLLGTTETRTFTPYVDPTPFQRVNGGVSSSIATQLRSTLGASLMGPLGLTGSTNLANSLTTVINNLEDFVVNPVAAAAGVTLAGADVRSDTMVCSAPQLVE